MKIVRIFANKLFAFQYENENKNELARLFEQWNDAHWLYEYLKKNGFSNFDIYDFSEEIFENLNEMLKNIEDKNVQLNSMFRPLNDSHTDSGVLIFQKGKLKNNNLRLYALKVDKDCYVITGGAIKMSQAMQDHPDTNNELKKLEKARTWLKSNDVFDDDSFYEFLIEQL